MIVDEHESYFGYTNLICCCRYFAFADLIYIGEEPRSACQFNLIHTF